MKFNSIPGIPKSILKFPIKCPPEEYVHIWCFLYTSKFLGKKYNSMPEFIKVYDVQCQLAQFNEHTKNTKLFFYKDIFICDLKVDNILYLLPFIKQIKTKTCIRSQIWNIISCNITVSIGTSNLISIILAYTAFS